MSTSPRRFTALLLAAAVVVAGACSDDEEEAAESPKQAFGEALDAFGDYEGFTVVVSLNGDAAGLAPGEISGEEAETVENSSLTISAASDTSEGSQAEFTFNIDGNEDAVQMRLVRESLYARVEVRDLVEAFGGDAAEVETAVQQATAAGLEFAQPLADGEWIGVEGIDQLTQQFGLPQATSDPEEASALVERVAGVLEGNARVTSEGTDDVGAHLLVAVPLKETARELLDTLQSFGGAAGALPDTGLEEVPDGEIPIDVWISDGRLVQLELDFVAIARELGEEPPEDVDEFALLMTIDEFTDGVEPPDDFVAIDLQEILQGFFGTMVPEVESPAG